MFWAGVLVGLIWTGAFIVGGAIGIFIGWATERMIALIVYNQRNRIRKSLGIAHIVPYPKANIKI